MSPAAVLLTLMLPAVGFLLRALWRERGDWRSTGNEKVEKIPLKNGWHKTQKYYEQVDVEREGRFRWQPYDGYTLVDPKGRQKYYDTTDYSM